MRTTSWIGKWLVVFCASLMITLLFTGTSGKSNPVYRPQSVDPHSFEAANNLSLLTNDDFAKYIDPQIVGADRLMAIYFLRLIPANKRGDFVYVNPYGRILSNRVSTASQVLFIRNALPHPGLINKTQISKSRRMVGFRRESYPPSGGSGGAYIRDYSQQGINAAYAYVSPPCDAHLALGESGNMYFNAYDANGSDVIDAGLGANNVQTNLIQNYTAAQNLTAFVNSVGGRQDSWTNQSQRYPCTATIGIIYGTLPNSGISMLALGIPSYDPRQFAVPMATAIWHTAVWNFFNTDPALLQSPGTWSNGVASYSSNCTKCSIARMFTIGQPTASYSLDGSCYGYCSSSGVDGFWNETVAGQLTNPCSQVQNQSFTCTIAYTTNWYAGTNTSGNNGIGYAYKDNQQAVQGINLSGLGPTSQSNLSFVGPLPPAPTATCTPDSLALCALQASREPNGYCDTGTTSPSGRELYLPSYTTPYYVFQQVYSQELLETASYVETRDPNNACAVSYMWSPNEPKIRYNDPNLP